MTCSSMAQPKYRTAHDTWPVIRSSRLNGDAPDRALEEYQPTSPALGADARPKMEM